MKRLLPMLIAAAFSTYSAQAGDWLLCANKGDHTMGIIDPASYKEVATVAEDGVTGHEVIASADGKMAFVPIYGNAGVGHAGTDGSLIRVIDLATKKVTGTIDFGKGIRPHCPQIGPKDGLLYVTTEITENVTIIDPKTLKVLGSIPTGQKESHMLALSGDGKHGYTANVASGTVSVLDIEGRKLETTIPICKTTQRIALSKDDHWAFTSDQQQPRLAVIDCTQNKVDSWIDLPGVGYGAAATPDGHILLVAIPKAHKVAVVDIGSMHVTHTIAVPASPQEMLVSPDGTEAYVSCDMSQQIAVINPKDWTVKKIISAGKGVDGLAWASSK